MWRKGWVPEGSVDLKPVDLCNACGILFKRGWFCKWQGRRAAVEVQLFQSGICLKNPSLGVPERSNYVHNN